MTTQLKITSAIVGTLCAVVFTDRVVAQAGRVPLEQGLTLTYASSLNGEPDFEHILVIERADPNEVLIRSSWNRGDGRWKSYTRPLSRRERQRSRAFYMYSNRSDTTHYRGYTLGMASSVILAELKHSGQADVAVLVPERSPRTPYRGTLTRVGTRPEQFSVILDSRRVSLPAIRVRGILDNPSAAEKRLRMEYVFLDDPDAAWYLEAHVDNMREIGGHKVLVQIGTGKVLQELAETLRTRCEAHVNDIYFATGSADVEAASNSAFQRIASVLSANPTWKLTIVGHTDSIGSSQANLDLSRRRAEAARLILVRDFKLGASRLTADGRGEREPLENNGTLGGRARNRRVELKRNCS